MGQVLPGLRTIALKPRGVKAGGIGTSASTSAWRLQALHERGDEIRDEAIVGGGSGYLAGELPVERPLQARAKQERRGGLQAGTGTDTTKSLFEAQIAQRNIIQAMRTTGVRRLVAVSAAPLSGDDGDTLPSRLLLTPLLWALLRPVYADMARMEDEIRQSGLDWTIVRPPRLTDKPPTGRYRTALNRGVRGGYTISRADLASAILTLLDDPTSIRAAVGIG